MPFFIGELDGLLELLAEPSESSGLRFGHEDSKYTLLIARSASSRWMSRSRRCEHFPPSLVCTRPFISSALSRCSPSGHHPRRICSLEAHCLSHSTNRFLSSFARPTLISRSCGFLRSDRMTARNSSIGGCEIETGRITYNLKGVYESQFILVTKGPNHVYSQSSFSGIAQITGYVICEIAKP
jgi:hypothetical protein